MALPRGAVARSAVIVVFPDRTHLLLSQLGEFFFILEKDDLKECRFVRVCYSSRIKVMKVQTSLCNREVASDPSLLDK